MPIEWAKSMNNLACAYSDRIQGDRTQNIEDAITICEQALRIMTREAMPIKWGSIDDESGQRLLFPYQR